MPRLRLPYTWCAQRLAHLHRVQHTFFVDPNGTDFRLRDSFEDDDAGAQLVVRRRFSEATSNVYGDAFACTAHNAGEVVHVAVKVVPLDDSDEEVLQQSAYDIYSHTTLQTSEWTERLVLEMCSELLEQQCAVGLPYLIAWYTSAMPVSRLQSQPIHTLVLSSDYEEEEEYESDTSESGSHEWFRRRRPESCASLETSGTSSSGQSDQGEQSDNEEMYTAASSREGGTMSSGDEGYYEEEDDGDESSASSWTDVPGMYERRSRAILLFSEIASAGTLNAYVEMHTRRRLRRPWQRLGQRISSVRAQRAAAPWHALIMHTMCSLCALQKYFGVTHHDLHLENVLLVPLRTYMKRVPSRGRSYWWSYRLDGRNYYVPAHATDVVPLLWDFGAAFAPERMPNNDFKHGLVSDDPQTDETLRCSTDYMSLLQLLDEAPLMSATEWQPYGELLQEVDDDDCPFFMVGHAMPLRDAIPHLFADRYSRPPPDLAQVHWLGRFDLDQRIVPRRNALRPFVAADLLA